MMNEIGSSRSDERIRRRALRIKRAAKRKAASKRKAISCASSSNPESADPFGFMVDKEGHCAVSVDDEYQKGMAAYLRNLKLSIDVTWTGYKSKDEDSIKRDFIDFLVGIFGSEGEEKFDGRYLAEHSKFTCMLTKTEACLLSGQKGVKLAPVECRPLVYY